MHEHCPFHCVHSTPAPWETSFPSNPRPHPPPFTKLWDGPPAPGEASSANDHIRARSGREKGTGDGAEHLPVGPFLQTYVYTWTTMTACSSSNRPTNRMFVPRINQPTNQPVTLPRSPHSPHPVSVPPPCHHPHCRRPQVSDEQCSARRLPVEPYSDRL